MIAQGSDIGEKSIATSFEPPPQNRIADGDASRQSGAKNARQRIAKKCDYCRRKPSQGEELSREAAMVKACPSFARLQEADMY